MAGFYTFTIAGLVLGIMLLVKRKNISFVDIIKVVIFFAGVCSLALFWYLRTPNIMYSGLNQPQYLSPEGYKVIFMKALKLMYYNWGLPVFAFFIITIASSFFYRKFRYFTLLMVLIPTIIWMFKYSADFRNLSFIVPFMCISSAFGLFKMIGLRKPLRLENGEGDINFEYFDGKTQNFQNLSTDQAGLLHPNKTLTLKVKLVLLSTSALSSIILLFFISDKFYLLLLNVYQFIHKYYFQSHRILYFIEYDFLLHVDFYQKVLIALLIILIILPIFILIKLKFRTMILLLIITGIFLNFTFFNKKAIVNHQIESFNKVDARNYYQWLEIFIKNGGLENEVQTNFKALLSDKVPRRINFHYIEKVSKISLEEISEKNYLVFLKVDNLDSETKDFIKNKFKSNDYNILFNDRDFNFLFFEINPGKMVER